ncbi:MAG: hypothetical protein JWN08_3432 [Frankiales bacterium]|nr:hypothetical protein [Frankiales bacterium]
MRTNLVISPTLTVSPKKAIASGPLVDDLLQPGGRSLGVSSWSLEPWLMRLPKQFGVPGTPTVSADAAVGTSTSTGRSCRLRRPVVHSRCTGGPSADRRGQRARPRPVLVRVDV